MVKKLFLWSNYLGNVLRLAVTQPVSSGGHVFLMVIRNRSTTDDTGIVTV